MLLFNIYSSSLNSINITPKDMTNPLLNNSGLPLFSKIKAEHVEPAIEQLLTEARAAVEHCLAANETYSWENLIEPLEQAEDKINKAWSPVSHMNSVVNKIGRASCRERV